MNLSAALGSVPLRRYRSRLGDLVLGVTFGASMAFSVLPAAADQLQYRPVNPNFGGSPLNGSFLFQEATAQNHFKDNKGSGASAWAPPTASEQLQQTLTNALMGQLTAKVADQLFGQNALPAGTWQIGGNTVTVSNANGQTQVSIIDPTGATTTVAMPNAPLPVQ